MSASDNQTGKDKNHDFITGEEFEEKLLKAELNQIGKQHAGVDKSKLFGLAFSGGGIRSATFSLGVMQALAEKGWLKQFHYLSTVSGGSYIGSSLTWLLHKTWKTGDGVKLSFDAGDSFPFKRFDDMPKAKSRSDEDKKKLDQSKMLLRYLRQHGNYLAPGQGITGLSLLAVILRGALLSLLVYIVPLIAAIIILNAICFFGDTSGLIADPMNASELGMNPSLLLALIPLFVFAFVSILYGLQTGEERPAEQAYEFRRKYEIYSKWLLIITGVFLILSSLPTAYAKLGEFMGSIAVSSGGLLATVFSILGSQKKGGGKIPLGLLAPVALILMVYGILLLAFSGAIHFTHIHDGLKWAGLLVVLLSVWLSRRVNINHISIHRYYRDRLMELFMPNAAKLFSKQHMDKDDLANEAKLGDMCQFANAATEDENIVGPYHIINAK